jgi:putative oxidoreductase
MLYTPQLAALSAGLLALRLVVGLSMATHGTQKLCGWFGGPGLSVTAATAASSRPGWKPSAWKTLAVAKRLRGLLLALRLLGPLGPALLIAVMLVAMRVHWRHGYFAQA